MQNSRTRSRLAELKKVLITSGKILTIRSALSKHKTTTAQKETLQLLLSVEQACRFSSQNELSSIRSERIILESYSFRKSRTTLRDLKDVLGDEKIAESIHQQICFLGRPRDAFFTI